MREESREKGIPHEIGEYPRILKTGTLKRIVIFEFYKKPMANPCPNLRRSGIPDGSQRATASNEILRRLKNTSREVCSITVSQILKEYMGELAQGGYPLHWRIQVLSSALKGYAKIWEAETKGEGFVNRPEFVTKDKRRAARLTGKATWFKQQKPRDPSQTFKT